MSKKTLVLGIGNTLRGDDGVGVHVVDVLRHQRPLPDGLELLDGEDPGFTLAGAIRGVDHLIVIDAARLDSAPGTVRIFQGKAMDRFVADNRSATVRDAGLLDLLSEARLYGRLPRRRALIGIQPELVRWSERLTDRVERAIPVASELARGLFTRWRQ